ncbi:hypothetical protein HJC23_009647, partial [Cyclotella cryptica]
RTQILLRRIGILACRQSNKHCSHSFGRRQVALFSALSPKTTPPSSSNRKIIKQSQPHARLLISGPNATGIVASFSQLLFNHSCDIVDCASESSSDDITDGYDRKLFFQRIEFDHSHLVKSREEVKDEIVSMCRQFGMGCRLTWGNEQHNMAIFVSKYDHCLWELLLRHRAGELECNISLIISNHENLRHVADTFGVPYLVFPIEKEKRLEMERRQLEILHEYEIDVIVLARYMQILSEEFLNTFGSHRIINIHHSFLPAFRGGKPYHRAHERGVKLIGATAHYTTGDLDEGPIIEQDIMRVTHRDDVKDLVRKGRTLEKTVLVSAIKAHLEERIIVHMNKCIVFPE